MKRFFYLLLIVLFVFWTEPLWQKPIRNAIPESVNKMFVSVKEFAHHMVDNHFYIDQVRDQISSPNSGILDPGKKPEQKPVEKPELTLPSEQAFSLGNIELGDTKDKVDDLYGEAMRESRNEYGLDWFTYHENYHNFMMVAYDDEEIVRGLFTNQDLLSTQYPFSMADTKEVVNDTLGEPEELIDYERFIYQVNSQGEYDIYQIDGSYVTLFYDIHEDDRLTAVLLIDADLESTKDVLYTPSSQALRKGFEYQLFDLTNATRINYDLPILEWDEAVSETARKHSTDMAENQYFGHTNLQNQTFSDRMLADQISFTQAGENLAYGQFNSIFAHLGLMNSAGHRENILHDGFTKLGIGVDFNESNQPFYTENFFTN